VRTATMRSCAACRARGSPSQRVGACCRSRGHKTKYALVSRYAAAVIALTILPWPWVSCQAQEPKAIFKTNQGWVVALAFSPDSKTLATASEEGKGTVELWEVLTGRHRATLQISAKPIGAVAFSGDSRLLAVGSDDNTIRLWDYLAGKERVILRGHKDWVRKV
jgi:WD40 repeat protein